MITDQEIIRRTEYHPALTEERRNAHQKVRETIASAMAALSEVLPVCRESSLVITKLEEAMFWANAAIARPKEQHLRG